MGAALLLKGPRIVRSVREGVRFVRVAAGLNHSLALSSSVRSHFHLTHICSRNVTKGSKSSFTPFDVALSGIVFPLCC